MDLFQHFFCLSLLTFTGTIFWFINELIIKLGLLIHKMKHKKLQKVEIRISSKMHYSP
jgi:hypothetical protein